MGLNETHATLLGNRGIDVEMLVNLGVESSSKLGTDTIAIPYRVGGEVVNHKYRTIQGEKKFCQDAGAVKCFYNFDVLTDETLAKEPLLVTEGEMDAFVAMQCGYQRVVSVPDGAPAEELGEDDTGTKYEYIEHARSALDGINEIIICSDGDAAGRNLLQDLALRLGRARCKWVKYPKGCKDLNDALNEYGEKGVTETVKRARWVKVDGVYRMDELPPVPQQKAYASGIKGLDAHYRIRLGDFAVVTGIPGHGKSTFLNDLCSRLIERYGLKTAFASFEQHPQADHRRALRTWYSGRAVKDMSEEELDLADKWINDNFVFLVPDEDDDVTLEWALEKASAAVIRYGAKLVVIDPWNEMDHIRPPDMSLTEYVGFAIKQFRKFARKHNCHLIVAAHPTKQRKNESGKFDVPTLYDISDCHDADTEVLTQRGWLTHDQVSLDDHVACFDLRQEGLQWHRPEAVKRFDHDGAMVKFEGPSIDIRVTPNHRMVIKPAWREPRGTQVENGIGRPVSWPKDSWSLCPAQELPGGPFLMPLAAQMAGGADPDSFDIGPGYASEDFLRLLGWWLAEGWVVHDRGLGLCQQVGGLADEMEAAMLRLGVDFSRGVDKYPDRPHCKPTVRWYIGVRGNRDLAAWFRDHCGKRSDGKRIPELVWGLSARLKRILLEALIDGDGHRPPDRNGASYTTTSPFLRDGVQRLAVECGLPCTFSERTPGASHHKKSWQINIGRADRKQITVRNHRHRRIEQYQGVVWCLTVPTGAFVTRRNGRVAITGNSAHWYNKADVGLIVHRADDETIVRVAKSRYHEQIGYPGDTPLWFNKATGRYEAPGFSDGADDETDEAAA